ncbi:decapping 5-like protein isoform X2 [Neltuma alba]|uniref:decapping 5-like protein isoform X2 n=1 Tax=Neltuma alba TaxID=207710 RepID=UPI0010A4ED22|nr:decapping 5-like protein isoform X2 [Prosopis alba]
MASDSGPKPLPASSSTAGESYIGSFISLISKYEIRYEGVLYHLDVRDSTIGLKSVRSYGTEGRRKDGPQVPPTDKVYEYILFRGSDIKDLQVKSPSTSIKEEQMLSDPAIIQSQYSEVPSNSPVTLMGGRSLTESIQRQDTPVMTGRDITLPAGLPSHQSATLTAPSGQSAVTRVSDAPSSSTTMYWPEYSGISGSSSHSLLQSGPFQSPSRVTPLNTQSWVQTTESQLPSSKLGWTTLPEHDAPSLLSSKAPLPYHSSVAEPNIPSLSSPFQGINSVNDQFSSKTYPYMGSMFPEQSAHHSVSLSIDSTSGSLPGPHSFSTPDQFAHSRENFVPLVQNQIPDQNHMVSLAPTSPRPSFLVPPPGFQAPLLPLPPLPTSVHKPQYSTSRFSEEFDFEAMNEKFKKDEVWGSLGRASKTIEGLEDNAPTDSLGDRECRGFQTNPNPKPAYKKDDFFDTISCNSLTRGSRNGQNRLSERMKLDSETFGNFHRSPPMGYGAYVTGRNEYYQNSYNIGRGYNHGGRGRGRNMPFY